MKNDKIMGGGARHVIGVVGLSYSGSTLLNYALDSHPQVYGGGELHWMEGKPHADGRVYNFCALCRDDCPVWTPENRAAVKGVDRFHDVVAAVTGKAVICDTSKMIEWFDKVMPAANPATVFDLHLMVKEIPRHMGSIMHKALVREAYAAGRDTLTAPDDDAIDAMMTGIHRYYRNIHSRFARGGMGVIRYERLIADYPAVTGRLLARAGLPFDPAMAADRIYDRPHHAIGGNGGALMQFHGKVEAHRLDNPVLVRSQEEKYARKGLFLDESHRTILTPRQADHIAADPRARDMEAMIDEIEAAGGGPAA